MNTWRMNGSLGLRRLAERCSCPSGTVRQPSTVWPSSATMFSNTSLAACAARSALRGRKTMPTPYSPGPGSVKPSPSARPAARKSCGICIRMPAPSPVFASQPQAPRWSRLTQDLKRLRDDVVGFAPLHVDDEAHAAGVVLERGVVQALLARLARPTPRGGGCRPVCRRSGARSGAFSARFFLMVGHRGSHPTASPLFAFRMSASQCRRPLGRGGVRSWINSGLEAGGRFAGAGTADPAQGARLNHQYEPDSTGAGR